MTGALALFGGAAAARAEIVRTPYVEAELAPDVAAAAPGGTVHVALRQKIKPGWHTYWRNPGDSGEPTRLAWTLPQGWSAGEIVWPTPERQPVGPLVNYGYSNQVLLPVPIRVPADARPGQTVRLAAVADWLVCEEICIPEQVKLTLDLPVAAGPAAPHPQHGAAVRQALAAAPKPGVLTGVAALAGGRLKLAVLGAPARGDGAARAYFFPYDGALIDHAKPQGIERGPAGLTLTMVPGYGAQTGAVTGPVQGVLSFGEGEAYLVEASVGSLPAQAAGLGAPGAGGRSGLGLPLALGFAFLGGLILNLMPCVFPVLSMKAAALAGHAHEPRTARVQGLAFLAGVLTTFLGLAAALLVARAAGETAGWGFQLQSPPVIAGLALLMLLIALNLSGVFHLGESVQGVGSGLSGRGGAAGAFFTGVLAVAVAAPCTAPFMAAAMGYAVVQPTAVALSVFAALGLGLAAPFVLVSFTPTLLRRLPRPGAWMETLQRLLAFPMYATAAWLAWIFARQTGVAGLAELFAAAWLVALAAWLFGRSQHSGRPLPFRIGASAAALLAVAWLGVAALGAPGGGKAESAALAAEAYTPERLAALRAEGRPVFVNFTADWCVTCKVNERVALSSAEVGRAFERTGVVYLKADWTNRDPVIAAALSEHGRAGVPLYLLYSPGADQPRILPQLLTTGAVIKALEEATPST
ncbi:MAG TPA: protein-disulfide reductase DsbD domain-containing protein [Caulobacteraceae bacterium]|nr:protein-disulfide reductase DsbD domain-containing protein [Caulobacteraceae bacterium]